MRHFDVEAVHTVVFDLEARDARARSFLRFEIDQECTAVVLDAAQLVELRIVAFGDDIAVAKHGGRLDSDRACEQRLPARIRGHRLGRIEEKCGARPRDRSADLGQSRERIAQTGKIARSRITQSDP
jgi:hypothetical protein